MLQNVIFCLVSHDQPNKTRINSVTDTFDDRLMLSSIFSPISYVIYKAAVC